MSSPQDLASWWNKVTLTLAEGLQLIAFHPPHPTPHPQNRRVAPSSTWSAPGFSIFFFFFFSFFFVRSDLQRARVFSPRRPPGFFWGVSPVGAYVSLASTSGSCKHDISGRSRPWAEQRAAAAAERVWRTLSVTQLVVHTDTHLAWRGLRLGWRVCWLVYRHRSLEFTKLVVPCNIRFPGHFIRYTHAIQYSASATSLITEVVVMAFLHRTASYW